MSGTLILQPFANSGDQAIPPQTDPSGFVNWNQGYTPYYEIQLGVGNPQAKAVERPVHNALFNIITGNIQAWQQFGLPQWYSAMPGGYAVNATVMRQSGGGTWTPYRSLVAANVSDPLTTPAQWEYVPYGHESLANVPMPTGGAGGPSAEVVTVATDFNTFTTGTWQYQTDAIAIGSAHAPAPLGGTAAAGLLESLAWAGTGANVYAAQRYLDRNGNSFFRGATNGTWSAWTSTTPASDFTTDTSGTVNLVSGTLPMASATLTDNQKFWVKIANTNTGAVTFTPNPSVIATPLAVVGQALLPLQGGELIAAGRALMIYKADTNNFALDFCSGGRPQVPAGAQTNQAVNLAQLTSAVNAYALDTSGTPNVIQAAFPGGLTTGNIADNQSFWVKVANTNTGATTFTPNPGTFPASSVTGAANSALQGGEIIAASHICLIWNAATSAFFLTESSNGSVQVGTATQSQQAATLGQVQALIAGLGASGYLTAANNNNTIATGRYMIDTSTAAGGAFLVNLQVAGITNGSRWEFTDLSGAWLQNNFTIAPGGLSIMGISGQNLVCNVSGLVFSIWYNGTTLELQ